MQIKRRRIPKSRHPAAIEQQYAFELIRALKLWFEDIETNLLNLAPLHDNVKHDGMFDDTFDEARDKWEEFTDALTQAFSVMALGVAAFTARLFSRQRSAAGYGETPITLDNIMIQGSIDDEIKNALRENVRLIKDIGEKAATDLERDILNTVRNGTSTRELAKVIQARLDITKTRAALIARDQTAKLSSNISRLRHEQAGVEEYIWRTVGDSRVRPAHAEREGKVFRYDSPPSDGNPGEPIACRCSAEPIFKELV